MGVFIVKNKSVAVEVLVEFLRPGNSVKTARANHLHLLGR